MKDVAIIGVGQSPFVRRCGVSVRELCFQAFKEAIQDAKLTPKDVDASIICSAPEYDKQRTPSGLLAEYLGLNPNPTFYLESVCSSGSAGLRVAYSLIKSGLHDVVAVLGFQKMSELSSAESQERMGRGADITWESPFGSTMPAYYAMHAQAHMEKYGTTAEQLAKVRVKSGKYGALNPKAAYKKEVTMEDVLTSDVISSPLKKFDCCANADGSSCIIVANKDKAKELASTPTWILGLGAATASMNLTGRDGYTSLACARQAAKQAYQMAGVSPQDIDVAEVHDCFTISEVIACEDLGFAEPGQGGRLVDEGETYAEGKTPVNVDGGLLSKGHPIGATGGSQIRTIALQLRGEGGEVQVKDAEIGLVHNIGGVGIYSNITILGR
jgi:acetyl-CoA C-acetyltransferase